MPFEYDPKKSASNKAKHGIDFDEAQALWDDEGLVIAPAKDRNEPRQIAVGQIDARLWTAIFTMRDGMVRLISVRRTRKKEAEYYEDHQGE